MFQPGTSRYNVKSTKISQTTRLQKQTERECEPFFVAIPSLDLPSRKDLARIGLLKDEDSSHIRLLRNKHSAYLKRPLYRKDAMRLPSSYISLDASRPWIIYWTLHGLDLLDDLPAEDTLLGIVHTLESCWSSLNRKDDSDGGGFGGGVGQLPHCATSYAAVNALSIIAGCDADIYPEATKLALDLLQRKREALLKWYLTLRYERIMDDNETIACGYRMHTDGEVDVRATYCICCVCSLLNILTDDLMNGMISHIVDCQTYEGGFGGEPFTEAHGGYTFCALGALHILTKAKGMLHLEESGVNYAALQEWLVNRQMGYEGGFQGRCNKLVDGCYTFWVGGAIALLGLVGGSKEQYDSGVYATEIDVDNCGVYRPYDEAITKILDEDGGLCFDQKLLQRFVLLCAQDVNGGLRDKPSKPRDFYHTCYNLSGLSTSQHVLSPPNTASGAVMYEDEKQNVLGVTHPVYNILLERTKFMIRSFHGSK